jgi:hypothetical protein
MNIKWNTMIYITNVSRISIFNLFIHNIDWRGRGALMPISIRLVVVTKTSQLGLNIPLFVDKFDHEQGLMHHYLYVSIEGCYLRLLYTNLKHQRFFPIKGTWLMQFFNSIFWWNNIENYRSNLLLHGNGFLGGWVKFSITKLA